MVTRVSIAFRRLVRSRPGREGPEGHDLRVSIAFRRLVRSRPASWSNRPGCGPCLHCLSAFSAFPTSVGEAIRFADSTSPLPFGV